MSVVSQQGGIGTLAHQTYAGYSGDVRPIPTVPDASLFEIDTRRVFVWHDSAWHFHAGPVESHDMTGPALLSELRKIRFGLETYLGSELPDPGE